MVEVVCEDGGGVGVLDEEWLLGGGGGGGGALDPFFSTLLTAASKRLLSVVMPVSPADLAKKNIFTVCLARVPEHDTTERGVLRASLLDDGRDLVDVRIGIGALGEGVGQQPHWHDFSSDLTACCSS